MQGASPLASPGLGEVRHWGCLWKAGYGGGACPGGTGAWWTLMRPAGGLAFFAACRPCPESPLFFIPISRQEDRAQTIGLSQYSIFGKSSGGSGGLFQESPSVPISRQEDMAQTIGFSQYSIFGKSSGGSGGLFQESPSVLPVVSPVPSANAVRRERVRERPSRCMTV